MKMIFKALLSGCIILTTLLNAGNNEEQANVVRELIQAFNAHDTPALMNLVTDDVKWLYIISPDSISLETSGREETQNAFNDYFKSVPTIRSEIEDLNVSGDYVTFRERVFWKKAGKEVTQSALCVYQIKEGKISNVWYFPADK